MLTTEVVRQLNLDQRLVDAIGLLRWPVVFVFLSIAVGVLYKLAPNVRVPFRWCLVGGALFSVGWILATALFGLYVANFANYSNTYGALGGVIVLMLWFYISALILVAAAALVAAVLKETQEWMANRPLENGNETKAASAPKVKVTSFEGAKGLSAQYVFLIGLHSGEMPRNAGDVQDIEICRFLVGITRTKKKCSMLVTNRFGDKFKRRSEFLSWIKKSLSFVQAAY